MPYVKLPNGNINQIQDNIKKAIGPAPDQESPIPGSVRIDVTFASGVTKKLSHRLGRPWSGYIVVYQDAAGSVYATDQDSNNLFISLAANFDGNASLLVF